MLLEELNSLLGTYEVTVHEPLYAGHTASTVYRGAWKGTQVAIKLVDATDLDVEQVEFECKIMLLMKERGVVAVHMCDWVKDRLGKDYFVMVMELCTGDLSAEIIDRGRVGAYWSESEVWAMLLSLVTTLAFMQIQGFAHRDIKPTNLFVTDTGLKLGDFGSATALPAVSQACTLVGSPLYMSPLLQQGLMSGQATVTHNVYKSDVYSLGMTFIHICSLGLVYGPASQTLPDLHSRYTDTLTSVLTWMTLQNEDERCDFPTLKEYIEQRYVQCLHCQGCFPRDSLHTPIQLICNPSDHLFCSMDCYSHYTAVYSLCKKCSFPVEPLHKSLQETLGRHFSRVKNWLKGS